MKTNFKQFKFLQFLFLAVFMLSSAFKSVAQESSESDLDKFLVTIQASDTNEIKMECKEGCAWKTLTYKLSGMSGVQAIDEYGMTNLSDDRQEKDNDLSMFLFTIERTENGLNLKGLYGTAWTDLSFGMLPNSIQSINEMGMID